MERYQSNRWMFYVMVFALFFSLGDISLKAGETFTNWAWVNFKLNISQTNFVLGEKIPASLVVSNTLQERHSLRWIADDSCGCGFSKFQIIESATGKEIECKRPFDGAITVTGRADLKEYGHKSFEFDLAETYSISKAGVYRVQAMGWFPTSEDPSNHQNVKILTPSLYIKILPKAIAQ